LNYLIMMLSAGCSFLTSLPFIFTAIAAYYFSPLLVQM